MFIYLQSTVIGNQFRTTIQVFRSPRDVPKYAITLAIFVRSAVAYTIVLALIGPENHGSHFERSKLTFQAGASKEDVISISEEVEEVQGIERSNVWSEGNEEHQEIPRSLNNIKYE